jgi:hypothetical protein
MTTAAAGGTHVRSAGAVPVHRAPARLRVVGGSGRLRWWHGRLTLGCTLAGAMVGALLGVAQAFLEVGAVPVALLEAYGAGAGLGTSIGLVTGLLLGLLAGLADRYLLPQLVHPRRSWIRHIRR